MEEDLSHLHAALYTVEVIYKEIKRPDEDLSIVMSSVMDYLKKKAEKKEGQHLFRKSLEKNEEDHVCQNCEKKFKCFSSLKRHCDSEHPDKPSPSRKNFKARDRYICLLPDKQNNNVQCRRLVEKSRISRHVLEYHKCKKPGKQPDEEPHQFDGFESNDGGKTWSVSWKKMKEKKKMPKVVQINNEDTSDTTEGNVELEEVAAVPAEEDCVEIREEVDVQEVQEESPREMSKRDVQEVRLEQNVKPLINHHIHDKLTNKWIETDGLPHPKVKFTVRVDEDACKTLNIPEIRSLSEPNKKYASRRHTGYIDSGAACCQGDQDFLERAGKRIHDLPQGSLQLEGAVGSPIELMGFIPMVITYNKTETRQFVYITKEKGDFLLGYHALLDLGLGPNLDNPNPNPIKSKKSKKRKADELS